MTTVVSELTTEEKANLEARNYKKASEMWVSSFTELPSLLWLMAYSGKNTDRLSERTPVSVGDHAHSVTHNAKVKIESVDFGGGDDFEPMRVTYEHNGDKYCESMFKILEVEKPTLTEDVKVWLIQDSKDFGWIMTNLEVISELGFRIFLDEMQGFLYVCLDFYEPDLYEEHKLLFLSLYKERGLQWHLDEGLMKCQKIGAIR